MLCFSHRSTISPHGHHPVSTYWNKPQRDKPQQTPQSSYLYVYACGQTCISVSRRSLRISSRFKSSFVLSVWWKVTMVTGLLGRVCWEDLLGLPSKHLQSQSSDSKNKIFSFLSHAATSVQILALLEQTIILSAHVVMQPAGWTITLYSYLWDQQALKSDVLWAE